MKKIFVDKSYNIVKNDSDSYCDEIDKKIDLVINAVEKGSITKEEGLELLKIVLSKEIEKDYKVLVSMNLKPHKIRSPFVFLLNHSSFIERYAS